MKTAKEVVKLIHALMNDKNNITAQIQAKALVKEYALEACEEQRNLCHFEWASIMNEENRVENESNAIKNAPEPKLK